jgi:hypothetical protein
VIDLSSVSLSDLKGEISKREKELLHHDTLINAAHDILDKLGDNEIHYLKLIFEDKEYLEYFSETLNNKYTQMVRCYDP